MMKFNKFWVLNALMLVLLVGTSFGEGVDLSFSPVAGDPEFFVPVSGNEGFFVSPGVSVGVVLLSTVFLGVADVIAHTILGLR